MQGKLTLINRVNSNSIYGDTAFMLCAPQNSWILVCVQSAWLCWRLWWAITQLLPSTHSAADLAYYATLTGGRKGGREGEREREREKEREREREREGG